MTKYDIRLCDSLEKVLPGTSPRSLKETRISVWPGEVFSFQIAAKALREEPQEVTTQAEATEKVQIETEPTIHRSDDLEKIINAAEEAAYSDTK